MQTRPRRIRLAMGALAGAGLIALGLWHGAGPQALAGAAAWATAVALVALHTAARLRPIHTPARHAEYGFQTAVEVLALILLPTGLAALVQGGSLVAQVAHRARRRQALDPVFGSAGATVAATVAAQVVHGALGGLLPGSHLESLLTLPAVAVFLAVQTLLVALAVGAALGVPFWRVDSLHGDSLAGDALMALAGAITARLYLLDPSALLLTLVPMALLYRVLRNVQQARLAHLDAKTGLFNCLHLDGALAEQVRRSRNTGQPLGLVFADLDFLREVNNTYGHLAGDRVLEHVGAVLRRHARPQDVAARFGGEEFVLLLPGAGKGEAAEVAERIRRDVAGLRILTDDGAGSFRVTMSLGVAALPADAATVQGLIKAADAAVYQAKHSGRNRVCAYTGARHEVAASAQ